MSWSTTGRRPDPIPTFTMRILRIAFLMGGLLASSRSVGAQVCGTVLPGEQQGLGPRGVSSGSASLPGHAEDRREIERVLGVAEQLVLKTVYGSPRGYFAFPHFNYDLPANRTRLGAYSFAYAMFCPTRAAVGGDGQGGVEITFNPYPQLWSESDRPMLDERGDRIYTERIRKPAQFGSTFTYGDFDDVQDVGLRVLFTAGGESPTLPVTREEYLRALIFTVIGPASKKTPYQEFMEQAPARKQARDEMLIVLKDDPAKAAKLVQDLEKAEREQAEQFKKLEGAPNPLVDQLRARIAAMTPAERAMPAFVSGNDFVPSTSPLAQAIVRENPAFYRARRSPAEPRAVLVRIPQSTYKELETERRQMFREFDWAALKRTVTPQ
jgi:hypothetical protein